MNFDFSVGFDRQIEDVSPYDGTQTECEELLQSLIDHNKIVVGERSEGNVRVEGGVIYLDYRWCSEVGEDWNDDVWNDETDEFPEIDLQ